MALISKKARYALHGLAYMATFPPSEIVPFARILGYLRAYSPGLTLSPGYIAKVYQDVSRAGLTVATVGARGGYRLARSPEQIRLIDVVQALDGEFLPGCCLLSVSECPGQADCGVRSVLGDAERAFCRFLEQHSLASLAASMHFPPADVILARAQEPASRSALR